MLLFEFQTNQFFSQIKQYKIVEKDKNEEEDIDLYFFSLLGKLRAIKMC